MGTDLSDVRAHQGGELAQGADAYTMGADVAFGATPDAFTAAHEATHALQQGAGQGPATGVGTANDPFEQQADAVGDAVASGKDAAPLLGDLPGQQGAPAEAAVQGLHGDLDAAVRPEIAAQNPAMAGMTVGEAGATLSPRDANFNPARKVEFEAALTARILETPGPAAAPVQQISKNMLAYFDAKVAAGLAQADADLSRLGANFASLTDKQGQKQANTTFFGRLVNDSAQLQGSIASEMRKLLSGGGSLPQQIFAHHQFIDQIWDVKGKGDFAQDIAGKLSAAAQQSGQTLNVQIEAIAPKHFRNDENGQERTEFAQRGRFNPGEEGSRVDEVFGNGNKVPTTGDAKGIAARPLTGQATTDGQQMQSAATDVGSTGLDASEGGEQEHQRGIDRLTMDESNAFVQNARLVLDMPLGGGISGTTTDLMEVGTILGCSDLHLYAIAVLGHLGSAGAHSFHEIAKAASFAGVPYRDGDYASIIPASYMPIVQDLFTTYADVVNAPAAAPAAAAPAATS